MRFCFQILKLYCGYVKEYPVFKEVYIEVFRSNEAGCQLAYIYTHFMKELAAFPPPLHLPFDNEESKINMKY